MNAVAAALTPAQWKTFIASFLGWTLDAFDFFLVIVVVPHLARDFGRSVTDIGLAVTLTLMMRPVGALVFGWLGDRYGRRIPLMIDVALFSVLELATAFSPNFTIFLILRVLFGIAMGGEWGLGAALAMEALPPHRRGLFSGILQEGYAVGNLLANLALWFLFARIGWRGMFVIGALPALLIFYIRAHVPESPAWIAGQSRRIALSGDAVAHSLRRYFFLFIYAVLFMTAFNYMSHGTQDLYPTFLSAQHHFTPQVTGRIGVIAALGAICGGILFGWLSQRFGRRSMIMVCAALGMLLIPLWAFSATLATIALGGFLMQVAVQGAWGIIPAHLNEISPPLARGIFPGFTYQMGNLISASALQIEASIAANRFALPHGVPDYAHAMAFIALIVFVAVFVLTALGILVIPEKRQAALVVQVTPP